jgi:hypothetical protein
MPIKTQTIVFEPTIKNGRKWAKPTPTPPLLGTLDIGKWLFSFVDEEFGLGDSEFWPNNGHHNTNALRGPYGLEINRDTGEVTQYDATGYGAEYGIANFYGGANLDSI